MNLRVELHGSQCERAARTEAGPDHRYPISHCTHYSQHWGGLQASAIPIGRDENLARGITINPFNHKRGAVLMYPEQLVAGAGGAKA